MKSEVTAKDRQNAVLICEAYDITCSFSVTGECSDVDIYTRDINIDMCKATNRSLFYSFLFHEIGHIYCYDNKKYIKYHSDCDDDLDEMSIYVRKYGLRAERFVDKIGAELMKLYFPDTEYQSCYSKAEDVKWYHDWVERTYP